jgi:hypothetical protein
MTDSSKLADLHAASSKALEEAYRRGHRAGCAETRERILKAMGVSETALNLDGTLKRLEREDREATRVERGTVRNAVQQVLSGIPAGLTIVEIGRLATAIDARIAESSIANELRRNKGKLYRRRNGRWSKIEEEVLEADTAGIAEDDHPPHMNGAGASG